MHDDTFPPPAKPNRGPGNFGYTSHSTGPIAANTGLKSGSTRRNAKGITLPPTPWDQPKDTTE